MPKCHSLTHTQEVSSNSDKNTNVKDLVRGPKVIQFSWEEAFWHTTSVQQRSNDICGAHAEQMIESNGFHRQMELSRDDTREDG